MTTVDQPAPATQSFRELLRRSTDLRLLFVAQFASLAGTQISRVVIPTLAVVVAHVSAAQAAAIVVAEYLPAIVLAPVIGAVADGLPTRAVLISCDAVRAAVLIAFACYLGLSRPTFLGLLLLSLVIGAASAVFDVTVTTVVPSLYDDDRRITATAGLVSSQYLTQITGPAVGGFVVQLLGAAFGLVVDAVSYLMSFALLGRLKISRPEPERPAAGSRRREAMRGFELVLSNGLVQRLLLGMALLNLGGSGIGAIFVLYLYRNLGFPPSAVGICFALNGAGMVLGSRAGARLIRRYREAAVIRASSGLCAAAVLLIPLASRGLAEACIYAYQVLFGFGASLWALSVSTSMQRVVPLEVLGRVNASLRAVVMSTFPAGALAAAVLASRFGVLAAIEILVAFVVLTPACYASRGFRAGALRTAGAG
ncbi:MAG: MFS transporter [Actinobacteria bacterium]|nr:MFS transporter [Actinomycetota bacterium]